MISHKIKQNSSFQIRVGVWFETKSALHMASGDEWGRYPYGFLDSSKWQFENWIWIEFDILSAGGQRKKQMRIKN